jgi:hypothetical protein
MNAVVSEVVVVVTEAADAETPVKHLAGTDQEPHQEEVTVMSAENQKGVNVGIVVTEAALTVETELTEKTEVTEVKEVTEEAVKVAVIEVMGAHVNSERAYASTAEKRVTSE